MNKNLIRRSALVAVAGAASLVLAACGSSDETSTGSSPSGASSASASQSGHSAADIAFAKGMIPHHRQAVKMADLAPSRAGSAEVKKLADEIKKAQDPEIKTLSGWLTTWGEQVPAEGAMDHSVHGAGSGMMTPEEMDKLKASSGKAFDTAFMKMMIKHHEGAVAMAKTEKADGSFPEAKTMADAIITSQTAEIARMNDLLGKN
ncbi:MULTISPECIES: DUF305 domain-containing protein [Streptomyces]|uniref:DUF305 domain-containing protein n=1 Tax=Streptomyces cavourensis TaxID=67258 RepID=A0ABY5FAH0_9ACTN|nr:MULTISPECIES: DUF305 domain-containing protein [Streptomyces]UTR80686.1 DUF305 domain-containing protein [Streptomyces cavourensis]WST13466.1 DUF305 domain-containing protein [Streptomyces microflavus]SCK26580.1 Uncharacterized conserved protein, DUF305 family [Streptomyces sp. ScaeMP-e48]